MVWRTKSSSDQTQFYNTIDNNSQHFLYLPQTRPRIIMPEIIFVNLNSSLLSYLPENNLKLPPNSMKYDPFVAYTVFRQSPHKNSVEIPI